MRKLVSVTVLLLAISCLLCGCFPNAMLIPSESSVGQSKRFEINGFSILLTEEFKEEQSQAGFDAYFVADFCGVVVKKEAFTLQKDFAEKTLEEYTASVMKNNGYTNQAPQTKDGLWFYDRVTEGRYACSYCYKGSDAFWIVQFICNLSDKETLADIIYLWAQSVEVK